jgi:cytochrome c peroxidase
MSFLKGLSFVLTVMLLTTPGALLAEEFTSSERATILSLGPWPPAIVLDHSNRASGDARAIKFGKKLFTDKRLSKDNLVSCAGCHKPELAFADGMALNEGYKKITRNTPAVVNLRWNNWFGWGGEADSLWAQSIRPILSRNEMAATPSGIRRAIINEPDLSCLFKATFDLDPADLKKQDVLVLVAKALAAFQETLVTGITAFDRFRNAMKAGDNKAMSRYPPAAKRGLKIFAGSGRCTFCHFGPRFSNGEFSNIGVPFFVAKGKVDQGRYGGIRTLKKNPYNLLGKFNDDSTGKNAVRTRHVLQRHRNWGEFKVPSLRNVARTAPYMHNGSVATLAGVVEFYSELDEERLHTDGEKILRPLNLTDQSKADLRAFLESLSSGHVIIPDSLDLSRECSSVPRQ